MRARPSGAQLVQAQGKLPAAFAVPALGLRTTHTGNASENKIKHRGLGISRQRFTRVPQLSVVAFRDAAESHSHHSVNSRNAPVGEHVSVHVDYYRLLQVPRVSRPDAIRKSYDHLMKQAPATSYSADTLFGRAVLLKAAAESLIDADLRRSYDAKLAAGHSALRVSQQDLPGVLIVLQEIGEYEMVLELGNRWLEINGNQPDAGDVAAAVALAHCDRAGERLTSPESQGAVLPACDDLDSAVNKLRRYGMAQQLQNQIVSALRDLAPEYACELAALPLGTETAARRAKGVALMRGVLRSASATVARSRSGMEADMDLLAGADEDPRSVITHARRMLQRGRDVLTCGEQVSILPDALKGSGYTPHPDVLYDGALAHIVDGFRNGWPHSVHTADRLLQQLEAHVAKQAATLREKQDLAAAAAARRAHYNGPAAATGPTIYHYDDQPAEGITRQRAGAGAVAAAGGSAGGDASPHAGGVALERAVCAVLLGDYITAVKLLRLDGAPPARGSDPSGADAQLRSFVMEHAPSGTHDLRPGLRALTARWLEGVALASFRDTAGQPVMPLDSAWFMDPRVGAYVQVRKLCRNEQVLAATHFLCNIVPNLLKFFAAAAVNVAATMALTASRAQRLSVAFASVAAATTAKRPPTPSTGGAQLRGPHSARASTPAGLGPSGRLPGPASRGAGAASVPVPSRAAVAMTAPVAAATATVEATPAAGAPKPSPFGHPYGKSVRETGPSAPPSEHASSSGAGNGSGHYPLHHQHGHTATSRTAPSRAAHGSTAAAAGAGVAVAGAGAAAVASSGGGAISDFRRRFAASAAVDAAPAAAEYDLHGRALSHADLDVGSHHDHDEEDEEDAMVDLPPEGIPRRGMTEQDLRAHLAGLEAAMWDSELPDSGAAKKRLIMLATAAIAIIAALFHFVFRRPDSAAFVRTAATPPAVVSITVSAFVTPN